MALCQRGIADLCANQDPIDFSLGGPRCAVSATRLIAFAIDHPQASFPAEDDRVCRKQCQTYWRTLGRRCGFELTGCRVSDPPPAMRSALIERDRGPSSSEKALSRPAARTGSPSAGSRRWASSSSGTPCVPRKWDRRGTGADSAEAHRNRRRSSAERRAPRRLR